jgi:hypothetical protein
MTVDVFHAGLGNVKEERKKENERLPSPIFFLLQKQRLLFVASLVSKRDIFEAFVLLKHPSLVG